MEEVKIVNIINDQYTLLTLIGGGGSAEVWRAKDSQGKEWAIKIYSPRSGMDDHSMQLFYDEYKKTSELRHPNILTPKEIGEWNNKPYIVFPLCEGSLMNEVHKRAKHVQGELLFSEMELAIILRDISSGLIYLQDNGIIHQDIKPDNILILKEEGEKRYVITDFGVSTKLRRTILMQSGHYEKNKTGFSPDYAAPEQFKGDVNRKSDIFSIGLSLIELAVGKLPSDDSKFPFGQILLQDPKALALDQRFTNRFKTILNLCLDVQAEKRPSADELKLWAEHYVNEEFWPDTIKEIEPKRSYVTEGFKNKIFQRLLIAIFGFMVLLGVWYFFRFTIENNGDKALLKRDAKLAQGYFEKYIYFPLIGNSMKSKFELTKKLTKEYIEFIPLGQSGYKVRKPSGWGLMNESRIEILPCIYKEIKPTKFNLISITQNDGLVGLTNSFGKILLEPKFKTILVLSQNKAQVFHSDINFKKPLDTIMFNN